MIDITLWSFVAVAVVVLATACTQAVVGFGFALLTVPIMMQIVGLQRAVILASLIGTANNVFQYRDLKHDQDKPQVKRFLWASFIGAPIGSIINNIKATPQTTDISVIKKITELVIPVKLETSTCIFLINIAEFLSK